MVLKLSQDKKKLVGIMRYRSKKRINCCIAGDFTRNGNIELIIGSEDKTIKIFDSIKAMEPKFIFYYDSWVTACTLGVLKLPNEKIPIYGLLVGTKNGIVQLIRFKEDIPDIVWQKDFDIQINDIKIGDVTNDGLNEILLSSDDSTIKILDSNGELIKEIQIDEGRPLSLLIEDIDGDNATEIVAGCADGSLKIFHNLSIESTEFELKWKTKVSTSIQDICFRLDQDNKKNIIFGGYDRTIRIVSDFEWGEKQPLDIPQQINLEVIESAEKDKMINAIANAEKIPTNIREHIFEILLRKGYLKDLTTELKNLNYTEDEILEELSVLNTQKIVVYEKVVYPVWSLPEEKKEEKVKTEAVEETQKSSLKHMVIEEPIKTDKEKLSTILSLAQKDKAPEDKAKTGDNLEDVILEYLREKQLIPTKAELVNPIEEKGFFLDQIEKVLNLLKEQGRIKYSRAKPKGWSLVD
jgi:WD40 repeat protein